MSELRSIALLPKDRYYTITTIQSVRIPGDQRSHDAPGHGFPEHTEYFPRVLFFTDHAEWLAELKKMESRPPVSAYQAAIVTPQEISVEVKVTAPKVMR